MSDPALSKLLKKDPIVEAVWELRFAAEEESLSEILPGMIQKRLFHDDEFTGTTRLATGSIPFDIVKNNPILKYAPIIRLEESLIAFKSAIIPSR